MSQFHFIEPLWFMTLVPLGLLLWLALRADAGASAWRRIIDPRLLAILKMSNSGRGSRLPLLLLGTGWLVAVIALANPTFERQPVPAFRSDAARVVVLDLSRSMLAEDLAPSRLERARYKVADILGRSGDGQVGLVVFADDAFAVSPLTDDAETIRAMLDALSPQIMPVQGSRPDRGIDLALDLLRQVGARKGEVILLSDDAGGASALAAAEQLRHAGHALGVVGVGSTEGAPVPGVTTADGAVISRLDIPALEKLAAAGAGRYATLSSSGQDLDRVLIDPSARSRGLVERDPMLAERWRELGPWVAVMLVPLAALGFRRGWLMALLIALGPGGFMMPEPVLAFGWADLWQRQDQQAAQALAAGELEQARALASAPARAGTAAYRLGDYSDAAERFAVGDTATDHYNRGNALARNGELEAALSAYDEALSRDPGLDDARYNREQVEAALRQQSRRTDPQTGTQDQPRDQQGDRTGEQELQRPSEQQRQDNESDDSGDGSQRQSDQQQGDSQQGADSEQQDGQGANGAQQTTDSSSAAQQRSGSESAANEQGSNDRQTPDDASSAQADGPAAGAESEEAAASTDASPDPRSLPDEATEDAARSQRAAADYRDEAAREQAALGNDEPEQGSAGGGGRATADANAALSPEEREARQAADQWLRRIPDDPAELLRRKFLYQYQTRQDGADLPRAGKPW
jgi:Ca-activated chloride channel family protein